MISVLVTGSATPLGERLVRSLLADTRVRHVLAVGWEREDRALPFADSNRLTYLRVDLTRSRQVRSLVFGPARDLGVEVVIHLAQHRSPVAEGRKVHQLNVESLRSILSLANRHPTIRRVIVKSYAEVYRVALELPVHVREDHPLDMRPTAPQYVRDRVEADLTACARMGLIDAEIVVLRCAEALGPGTGSQLYAFLNAPVALRPMGYDPMINVATVADVVRAVELATHGSGEGVFNIPGFDTLPLSEAIRRWGTPGVPLPGGLLRPLYQLRRLSDGSDFDYALNQRRMHYGLVLDGARADRELHYQPANPVDWPIGGPIRQSGSPSRT